MAKTNYLENYKPDNTRFGGLIYAYDFDTDYRKEETSGSSLAQRIVTDMKFDEQCRRNIANREKNGHAYHSFTRKEK